MINRMAETLEVTLTGRNKPVKTSQAIGKLQQLSSFIRFFDQHWQKFEYRNNSIVLPTRSALFRDLFEMYYNTSLDLNFLQFKWPSLSAGEESLISYFSRLYSVLHEIKDKHTLMLIDEGDLYFHPEWQRDYIYFLLEFLNSSLLNSPGLQLIVTTHSPFIISDLPSENIILLVKDKSPDNERDTVTVMPIKEQTFGGNLYTLFAKAFFLDDSSTSKFAKNKILTEIIVPLESQGRLPNRGYIRQLIDRIGEPVLRDILSERLEIKN
jgi:predicted ATP-dependent endonuclease of OLD family